MEKKQSKIGKVLSTIFQVIMGLGLLIVYAFINSLSEIKGGMVIATGAVFLIIIGYLYIFLIGLLTKESIDEEVKNYDERKWYKKTRVWLSALFVLIFIISGLSVETNLISTVITIVLISIALLILIIPRVTIPILVLYLLAEIVIGFMGGSVPILTALGSLLMKGAYILLCIRVFLVANKLNSGKKELIISKRKEEKTLRDIYTPERKDDFPYQQKTGINKVIIWSLSVSLFILIWIGIFSLLGFRINKEYFTYDENVCITDNWIGNKYYDGIDDCVYWARYNDLTAGRDLEEEWNDNENSLINCPAGCEKDLTYADFKSFTDYWEYSDSCEDSSVICNFSDYIDYIHFSNKDYLKSEKRDSFFEACVNKICKRPSFITVK